MREACGITRLLLAGTCVLTHLVGADADDQAAGESALQTWQAWQETHPLPLLENDKAEEALVGELFSLPSFAETCDALVEREVRREYSRLVGIPP
jgi:hypothetical protein